MYRIALVENEIAIRECFRWVLESAGYQVQQFSAAWQFLKTLSTANFDLIIMNMTLPDVEGSILAWLIRNELSTAHIPILATTVLDRRDANYADVAADEMPWDDIIYVPVDPDSLLAAVRDCLILRRDNDRVSRSNWKSA